MIFQIEKKHKFLRRECDRCKKMYMPTSKYSVKCESCKKKIYAERNKKHVETCKQNDKGNIKEGTYYQKNRKRLAKYYREYQRKQYQINKENKIENENKIQNGL